MDFTLTTYKKLLNSLQKQGFSFLTFVQYTELKAKAESENSPSQPKTQPQPFSNLQSQPLNTEPRTPNPKPRTPNPEPQTHQQINKEQTCLATSGRQINKSIPQQINKSTNQQINNLIILRHDVDARPQNSLAFARIQAKMGISGTYYFRMVPQSYDEAVIKEMVELGHEVGYHYETMDTCKGNIDKAYDEFCRNLETFQKLTPVKTISMHGSPMSPYDNREIWKKYDYKKLGIIAEPYFDINFNELYYITDTGRRWDGHLYNVRDKATKENPVTNPHFLQLRFHSTFDLINAINANANSQQLTANSQQPFPPHAMLNFHPQRWNDKPLPWLKELFWQNVKNQVKRIIIKRGN